MKISVRIIAAAAALAACGLASAQSAGSWMARVGVTHLSPDVNSGNLSAPSFPNTKVDAGSNTQLGGGITYMVTDNLALDVPLATPFKHDLSGAGSIAGVGKLGSTKAIPATLMLQYRFNEAKAAFRPYLGVGVTYAHFYGEKTTATLNGLTGAPRRIRPPPSSTTSSVRWRSWALSTTSTSAGLWMPPTPRAF
jgi:outer membrane protein